MGSRPRTSVPQLSPKIAHCFGNFSGALCFYAGSFGMIMHQWTAKHWIISSIIILVAVAAFALSWS